MPLPKQSKVAYPCALCHFCVKVELETHGSQCVWYDMYMRQDDALDSHSKLRTDCAHDKSGDRFAWRLPNVGALDYAKWRQSILHLAPASRRATFALVVSLLSLAASILQRFI